MIARAFWFLVWAALRAWAVFCPKDVITLSGDRYMTRYYLRGSPGGAGPSLRLQHIHRPDAMREFHDHPWFEAQSRILRGWYVERRFREYGRGRSSPPHTFTRNTGARSTLLNLPGARDRHRITAVAPDGAWTLFRTSERHGRGWGFQ